jgi:hypothetical protein
MAFIASAIPAGAPTTSFTIVIPAVLERDALILAAVNRNATTDPSVTDDDTGGELWQKLGGGATGLSVWGKRATSATSGKTVTCTGFTNSSAGALVVYRGGVATGNFFQNLSTESNASGNVTHAGFTPSLNGSEVVLVVANRTNDLAVTSQSSTSPGALAARAAMLSTGGNDCSISIASATQATAGATGNLTWSQTAAASVSCAFNLIPRAFTPDGSLTQTEINMGYVRPIRRVFVHSVCGMTTPLGGPLVARFAREPDFLLRVYCQQHGTASNADQFTWAEDSQTVGS